MFLGWIKYEDDLSITEECGSNGKSVKKIKMTLDFPKKIYLPCHMPYTFVDPIFNLIPQNWPI
jgi:hypothetical protein